MSDDGLVDCPYCRRSHLASLVPGCAYDHAHARAVYEDDDAS